MKSSFSLSLSSLIASFSPSPSVYPPSSSVSFVIVAVCPPGNVDSWGFDKTMSAIFVTFCVFVVFPKALFKLLQTKGKDKLLRFCSNHFLTLRHETGRPWRSAYSKDLLFANGSNNRQSKLSGSLQTREL